MGESKLKLAKREEMLMSCAGVQTMAGRVQVRWETDSAATPMGQLAYFIEFLNLTGLWSRWLESCPLNYTSPNAPSKAEVLGTWMLSMLAGHRRYSHVTTIRCDGINPGLLGMRKVISEDALRNALKRIPEAEGTAWLDAHLADSVAPLLDAPWILDTDTTIKPLYGHQEGAVIGYNPRKPGRPSHAYHTYLMAGLRQVLGVEVRAGNEHTAKHAQPGLLKILDALPVGRRPKLVRGDNAFGNDGMMMALEERQQPYLFKLKLSKNVKRHIGSLFRQPGWTDAGQGWEGLDGELALTGWQQKRRVIVLRRPLMGESPSQTTMRMTVSSSLPLSKPTARPAKELPATSMPFWSPTQITRYSAWDNSIATGPMPRMPLTNSRISGVGAALPRTICTAANLPREVSHWHTTGGVCSFALPIPMRAARRSLAGRG
jgi:hypothetical protein